jgi:hypothetical protein
VNSANMSFDMTNWSSMQVNPMEAMAANFGAFMTKVNHLSQRRRRPTDIELLSTTTDTERWFPAYARSQNHDKARLPEALLRNLPLYFTPQVNTDKRRLN